MTIINDVSITTRNNDLPALSFPPSSDSNYELVIERYSELVLERSPNNLDSPTNAFSFTLPQGGGFNPVEVSRAVVGIAVGSGLATWRDSSMSVDSLATLVALRIEEDISPTGVSQSWIAVFGSMDGAWALWDASLYFLTDGDTANLPRVEFRVASSQAVYGTVLPGAFSSTEANACWSMADTISRYGYAARLTPSIEDPLVERHWRMSPEFNDIRTGFVFSRNGNVALYSPSGATSPVSPELAASEHGANYRISTRRPLTPVIPTTTAGFTTVDAVGTVDAVDSMTTTDTAATIRRQSSNIVALEADIATARNAIKSYTLEHEGCEFGKREFLTATGLFAAEEIDEFFERDYEVSWSVTVTGTYTTTAYSGIMAQENVEELSQSDIDTLIRGAVSNENFDIEITDVEEA